MNQFYEFQFQSFPQIRFMGSVSYKTPWLHFTRTMNEYALYFIKSGELFLEEDHVKYDLHKNDFILLDPEKCHQGYRESCCNYYYIHFSHDQVTHLSAETMRQLQPTLLENRRLSLSSNCLLETNFLPFPCYLPKTMHCEDAYELQSILNLATAEYNNRYENYKVLASLRFTEFLIKLSREYVSMHIASTDNAPSGAYYRASKLVQYLTNNYSSKITSEDIEKQFSGNYDYLNRVFQKVTGMTIFAYLNRIRIDKAKELIMTASLRFNDIAYLVGINDPYYFSRLFKKLTGETPSQFSKTVQHTAALPAPEKKPSASSAQ